MADMTADPGSQDATGADAGAQPGAGDGSQDKGYTICIVVDANGQIAVGVLPGTDADGDGDDDTAQGAQGAAPDGDHDFAPAKNIKEALTVALDIYRNDGEMSEMTNGEDDMAAGFSGASGSGQ